MKEQAVAIAIFIREHADPQWNIEVGSVGDAIQITASHADGDAENVLTLYPDGSIRFEGYWGSQDYWDAWEVEPGGTARYAGTAESHRKPPPCIEAVAKVLVGKGERA